MPAATKAPAPTPVQTNPEEAIERAVLKQLGRPKDLHDVQVRALGGDRYRVNVRVDAERKGDTLAIPSVRTAHSYYLHATPGGTITACNPAIQKTY